MSKHETTLNRRYWTEIGGTLIEEFPTVRRGADRGHRLLDGVVILWGPRVIAKPADNRLRPELRRATLNERRVDVVFQLPIPETRHMNKSELCAHVAASTSVPKATADAVVSAVFSTIAETLARNETVAIAGFGTFTTRARAAREGRKPRYRREHCHRRFEVPRVQGGKEATRDGQRWEVSDARVRAELVSEGLPVRAVQASGSTEPPAHGTRDASRWLDLGRFLLSADPRPRHCATFGAGTIIDVWSRSASMPCGCSSGSPDP